MLTLLLAACSSVTLLDSGEGFPTHLGTLATPSACYTMCETLWTPAPECAVMAQGVALKFTVPECQTDCDRADHYFEYAQGDLDDYWVMVIVADWKEYEAQGYDGCMMAEQSNGATPCIGFGAADCDPAS